MTTKTDNKVQFANITFPVVISHINGSNMETVMEEFCRWFSAIMLGKKVKARLLADYAAIYYVGRISVKDIKEHVRIFNANCKTKREKNMIKINPYFLENLVSPQSMQIDPLESKITLKNKRQKLPKPITDYTWDEVRAICKKVKIKIEVVVYEGKTCYAMYTKEYPKSIIAREPCEAISILRSLCYM